MADDAVEIVGRGNYKYPVGYKCDIELYRILKRCSDKKDMSELDAFMCKNDLEYKYLQGADLSNMFFGYADFHRVKFENARFYECNFVRSKFFECECNDAEFFLSTCDNVSFLQSNCIHSRFLCASCSNMYSVDTDFSFSQIYASEYRDARFESSKFCFSNFIDSHCESASFVRVVCHGATFNCVYFDNATFSKVCLYDAKFINVKLSQGTTIVECEVNDDTVFVNVVPSSIITEPGTRAFLERNARRHSWEEWYPHQNFFMQAATKAFWLLSDYGYSTTRVFGWFLGAVLFFTVLYAAFPDMLNVDCSILSAPWYERIFRMGAFATATMVTLGFGNINVSIKAMAASYAGTFFVTLNLMVGYFMLAVLVTRLAVLFQTMGPGLVVEKKKNSPFTAWMKKIIEQGKDKCQTMNAFKAMGKWWQNKFTSWRKPKQ